MAWMEINFVNTHSLLICISFDIGSRIKIKSDKFGRKYKKKCHFQQTSMIFKYSTSRAHYNILSHHNAEVWRVHENLQEQVPTELPQWRVWTSLGDPTPSFYHNGVVNECVCKYYECQIADACNELNKVYIA